MYKIIGGDGQEYGPVTEADLSKWIAEGRLSGQSLAKAEGDAEFRRLSTFPEFAGALGDAAAAFGVPAADHQTGAGHGPADAGAAHPPTLQIAVVTHRQPGRRANCFPAYRP